MKSSARLNRAIKRVNDIVLRRTVGKHPPHVRLQRPQRPRPCQCSTSFCRLWLVVRARHRSGHNLRWQEHSLSEAVVPLPARIRLTFGSAARSGGPGLETSALSTASPQSPGPWQPDEVGEGAAAVGVEPDMVEERSLAPGRGRAGEVERAQPNRVITTSSAALRENRAEPT